MKPQIHTFDDDADDQLSAMGLSRQLFRDRHHRLAILLVTPFHPSNGAGLKLYLEAVKSIREELIPRNSDWIMDESGLALTCNEKLGIAIAVRSGDANVGDPKRNPSFKYPESDTMIRP